MITDELLFGERRQFLRKECIRMISINDYSKLYSGHLRDLALGGAFVEPREGNLSDIGKELLLSIPFGLREGYVNIQAKIAWHNHDGIGVWFLNSNIKQMAHP